MIFCCIPSGYVSIPACAYVVALVFKLSFGDPSLSRFHYDNTPKKTIQSRSLCSCLC